MKKNIFIFILFLSSVYSFGQKIEFNLIKLDSTWGQEVIRFPARHMEFTGVGDIRFPPEGWRKPEHKNFWSYTYAWEIDVDRKIPEKELELDLVKYFNSLNHVDMKDTEDKRRAFSKINKIKTKKTITYYKGYVKTFDRFATNTNFTLNVLIESHYCKKKKRTILHFKFSPKEFTHETWKMLKKIKLHADLCD